MFRRLLLSYVLLVATTAGVFTWLGAGAAVWIALTVGVLIGAMPALWIVHRLARSLATLDRSGQRLAAGDFGHQVYVGGKYELGALGRTINRMSQRLADQFTQLEADRQQLRAILSGMVEGVIALDAEQRILFANASAAQLLDFQVQAVVGRMFWEVFRHRSMQDLVTSSIADSAPREAELNWTGTTPRTLMIHAASLSSSTSRGCVLVLHDVSELRRLEQVRREFVANVSHELKTPLAVIRACAETLIDGAINDLEHRTGFLEQISDQSDRLNTLILDLLTLNRIEAGTEAFVYQAVGLDSVVKACVERHRTRAESKRQRLEAAPYDSNGVVIEAWADAEALEEVIDNLLDNALKYTPEGGRIRVGWKTDGDKVVVTVEDNGIGISERDLPRVFERFFRVDKARSREMGSTGLGLAIVKHIAQAMHGSVLVTSEIGRGSTFSVLLPRAPTERA